MKNTFLRSIVGGMLTILALVAFGQVSVQAQEGKIKNNEHYAKNLEGSWDHVTTRRNCQTGAVLGTFQAMFTFSQGGTFWEAGTNVAPSLRSVSHGVWERDSPGVYTTAFQFFRFNADGSFAGRQIVRQHIEVSDDGETYTASAIAEVLDAAGNVTATNCATGIGTRFD
jgi:hypothetical protein